MFILNVLFYFVLQSTFYMNKDKALESVNEIKELMEKSSKFISVQSPNQKIPDRKTKCVIKTHINIKQNVIFSAKLKPV